MHFYIHSTFLESVRFAFWVHVWLDYDFDLKLIIMKYINQMVHTQFPMNMETKWVNRVNIMMVANRLCCSNTLFKLELISRCNKLPESLISIQSDKIKNVQITLHEILIYGDRIIFRNIFFSSHCCLHNSLLHYIS